MKNPLRKALRAFGFDVVRYRPPGGPPTDFPADLSESDRAILGRVHGFTMTSLERQIALIEAVRHVARRGVPGCLVECGVWRGGSSMAAALALLQEGQTDRDLYLFDTFEGMSPPTDLDRTADGTLAATHLEREPDRAGGYWCRAGLEDVRANMASVGYPAERLHFIPGPVERTIPEHVPPAPIALLRLDTDWYESTRHELEHLFPLVVEGGILLIDDYGHWQGARKAVDEYLAAQPRGYYLHRIDDTGRLLVK